MASTRRFRWSTISSVFPTWRHMDLAPWLLVVLAASLALLTYRNGRSELKRAKLLIKPWLALVGGIALGTIMFFDHIWGYFFRLGFPLVSAPVFLFYAIATTMAVRAAGRRWRAIPQVVILLACIMQQAVNLGVAAPERFPKLLKITPGNFYYDTVDGPYGAEAK